MLNFVGVNQENDCVILITTRETKIKWDTYKIDYYSMIYMYEWCGSGHTKFSFTEAKSMFSSPGYVNVSHLK